MKTLHFSIRIQAPRERVWRLMLEQESYRQWTTVFCEGSYYEGTWGKGQRIRFLTPEGQGMFSEIDEYIPNESLSIRHLGELANGVEDQSAGSQWANACENYTFTSEGAATLLKVDVDAVPEFEAYMADSWPKALARLKELCEALTPTATSSIVNQQLESNLMSGNPSVYFEIYVQDIERARKFYEGVFQKTLKKIESPVPGLDMLQFEGDQHSYGASGAIVKMDGVPSGGNSTLVYFGCKDCAVEAERVVQFGGSIFRPKMSIGQYGFIVLAKDTEGNMIGLHSM